MNIYSFNPHNNPEMGTIINIIFNEEMEVQRGKVTCPRVTQLISDEAEIWMQEAVKWGRGQKTNERKVGHEGLPFCSLQDLRTIQLQENNDRQAFSTSTNISVGQNPMGRLPGPAQTRKTKQGSWGPLKKNPAHFRGKSSENWGADAQISQEFWGPQSCNDLISNILSHSATKSPWQRSPNPWDSPTSPLELAGSPLCMRIIRLLYL